ncbi:MAG: hypothetical protein ACD_21C00325G0006 [uncultured bacterium]|nr:MAG: hypothetical protein ACD_21C00325G0006 [uncultured bacterium]
MNKCLLGVIFLSVSFFITSAQATDNIYKIDTNGAEDSPKSIMDLPAQDRVKADVNYLNVKPSATFGAFAGKRALGQGQVLLPFGGDGVASTFYGALEATASGKTSTGYSGGFGGGYREVFNNSYLLGGYALADYNRSPLKHNFWVGGFGVEALGYAWDLRVNGYIPVGKKYWLANTTTGAYEEAGIGFDAEVGRVLPIPKTQGVRLFVGGYRYSMNNTIGNITGIEARLVYPITRHITLEVRDSYDSTRYNIAMGGLRLTLGGYNNNENKEELGISGRMSDPIERNFANFASCNTTVINRK